MALRSGHGIGAGMPRIEVMPADEQPVGVPDVARSESPADRGARGLFARGNGLASKGGRARAGKTRLADRLGLKNLPKGSAFAPYKASAARPDLLSNWPNRVAYPEGLLRVSLGSSPISIPQCRQCEEKEFPRGPFRWKCSPHFGHRK
jgi:hypothetical protein